MKTQQPIARAREGHPLGAGTHALILLERSKYNRRPDFWAVQKGAWASRPEPKKNRTWASKPPPNTENRRMHAIKIAGRGDRV